MGRGSGGGAGGGGRGGGKSGAGLGGGGAAATKAEQVAQADVAEVKKAATERGAIGDYARIPASEVAAMSTDRFGSYIKEVAATVEDKWGGNQVWIDVWKARTDWGMTREQFNQRLLTAHRADAMNMRRFDLVTALSPSQVARNERSVVRGGGGAEFNLIDLRKR